MVERGYYDWIFCPFATNLQDVGKFLGGSYKCPRGGAPSFDILLVVHVGLCLWWKNVRICYLFSIQKQRSESIDGTGCCSGSGKSCANDTIFLLDDLDDHTNWYYFTIHVFLAVQQLYVHITELGLLCACDCWRVSLESFISCAIFDHGFPNQHLYHPLKLQIAERRGPGGIVPYRVYVNSGVIFLCVVALAPLCPVLAPFSTLYFMFIYPLLKWGHIFVYRPTFDAGGMRWPLLHNILMNSVIVSQVRTTPCWKNSPCPNILLFCF